MMLGYPSRSLLELNAKNFIMHSYRWLVNISWGMSLVHIYVLSIYLRKKRISMSFHVFFLILSRVPWWGFTSSIRAHFQMLGTIVYVCNHYVLCEWCVFIILFHLILSLCSHFLRMAYRYVYAFANVCLMMFEGCLLSEVVIIKNEGKIII